MTRALAAAVVIGLMLAASPTRAEDVTARAKFHYDAGVTLFEERKHEQALIEFAAANDIKPRPAAVFMMAQCEYLLGRLKEARAHYQDYIDQVGAKGEFVELARDRVTSIDRWPSTFAINTVPDEATVTITPEGETGKIVATGVAPNNFSVPRGRYRVDVVKANHQGQTRVVDIGIAETKPLFFKLDPIPARLEIETVPPGATLYINGNRARNPYRQDVAPGRVEVFSEAPDHLPKTLDLTLVAGERRIYTGDAKVRLTYVQRSGRSELMVASGLIGGLLGAGAVAAAIGKDVDQQNVSSVFLVVGGGIAGAVAGTVIATPLVPKYIPDNRAFFVLATTWIGAAEGMGIGFVWRQVDTHNSAREAEDNVRCLTGPEQCRTDAGSQLRAAFVGSIPGLAIGLTSGALLSRKAPTYGRVAMIQSTALGGMVAGALMQVALQWKPYGLGWEFTSGKRKPTSEENAATGRLPNDTAGGGGPCPWDPTLLVEEQQNCIFRESSTFDLAPGALIGLNVGLVAGLLASYLPDQSKYGPTWKRVLLIDLAAGAGALAAGVGACVALSDSCLRERQPDDDARAIAAGAALIGGGLGLLGGYLLTRNIDEGVDSTGRQPTTTMPMATFAPLRDGRGSTVPGFAAVGFF